MYIFVPVTEPLTNIALASFGVPLRLTIWSAALAVPRIDTMREPVDAIFQIHAAFSEPVIEGVRVITGTSSPSDCIFGS